MSANRTRTCDDKLNEYAMSLTLYVGRKRSWLVAASNGVFACTYMIHDQAWDSRSLYMIFLYHKNNYHFISGAVA